MSKIKRLVIKNCLGIEELQLNVGKVNVISGGNERGKTSILESIEKACYNTQRRARFVRHGADKGYLEIETDDGINIKRNIQLSEDGSEEGSVKVTVDGIPKTSPESFLKELFGVTSIKSKAKRDVFAFNPVDFMNKQDREQTDILLSLLPISVTEKDAEAWFGVIPAINYTQHGLQVVKAFEKHWYDARREANAAVKATENEALAVEKRLPDNYRYEEWEQVQLSALYEQTRQADLVNISRGKAQEFLDKLAGFKQDVNNKYDLQVKEQKEFRDFRLQKERQAIEDQKKAIQAQIVDLTNQIIELEKKRDRLYDQRDNLETMSLAGKEEALERELQATLKGVEENRQREIGQLDAKAQEAIAYLKNNAEIDVEPLKFQAKHAEEMKAFIPLAKELVGIRQRLQQQEQTAHKYNMFVELCREKPAELLAQVELPLEGLGIDDNGFITINGLPLRNLSTSKQVRICLDIARTYAKDNLLKLICVDKLEHLDYSVRAEFLKQIEEDPEFQYFVTLVTDGDLHIEAKGA